jgi:hypothetical protein
MFGGGGGGLHFRPESCWGMCSGMWDRSFWLEGEGGVYAE